MQEEKIMKSIRKIIAIVLVLVTVLGAAAIAENSVSGDRLIATGNCYLRKGPGLDYDIVAVIHKGDKVTRDGDRYEIDARGVVWYRVMTAGGKLGWASSVYIHYDIKEVGRVKTTGSVNIRDKASKSGKILGVIEKGKTVNCAGMQRDENGTIWYLVTYANKVGWVSSKYAVEAN